MVQKSVWLVGMVWDYVDINGRNSYLTVCESETVYNRVLLREPSPIFEVGAGIDIRKSGDEVNKSKIMSMKKNAYTRYTLWLSAFTQLTLD